jgi:hypothetical protein
MIEWMVEVEDVNIARPVDDMTKNEGVHPLAHRGDGVRKGEQGFRPFRPFRVRSEGRRKAVKTPTMSVSGVLAWASMESYSIIKSLRASSRRTQNVLETRVQYCIIDMDVDYAMASERSKGKP